MRLFCRFAVVGSLNICESQRGCVTATPHILFIWLSLYTEPATYFYNPAADKTEFCINTLCAAICGMAGCIQRDLLSPLARLAYWSKRDTANCRRSHKSCVVNLFATRREYILMPVWPPAFEKGIDAAIKCQGSASWRRLIGRCINGNLSA